MLQHPASVRAAFEEAARTYLDTIRAVQPHQWQLPGLGEWNVRELASHTLRAFSTIEAYVNAEPVIDRIMDGAADYYHTVLGDPSIHAAVAKRGHDGGAQLDDPVGESEATTQRVLALVASTADDEPVNTFAGQVGFSEYLATRTVELGVHTLDLQRATGQPRQLHPATSSIVVAVLAELANPVELITALTGRGHLASDCNVLS